MDWIRAEEIKRRGVKIMPRLSLDESDFKGEKIASSAVR